MILIWGFKALFKAIDQGHFFCPNEGGDRNYRRMQARRWFTFFWMSNGNGLLGTRGDLNCGG